jgi:uncharacterized protein (TIGR00251 family)
MVVVRDTHDGVTLNVKVHPRAKKNAITGEIGEALKLSLTAPPIAGQANEACIEFFAAVLKVPRSSIRIASGQSSRRKTLRIWGISADEVRRRLNI